MLDLSCFCSDEARWYRLWDETGKQLVDPKKASAVLRAAVKHRDTRWLNDEHYQAARSFMETEPKLRSFLPRERRRRIDRPATPHGASASQSKRRKKQQETAEQEEPAAPQASDVGEEEGAAAAAEEEEHKGGSDQASEQQQPRIGLVDIAAAPPMDVDDVGQEGKEEEGEEAEEEAKRRDESNDDVTLVQDGVQQKSNEGDGRRLHSITHVPISGEANRCFYRVVERQASALLPDPQAMILRALNSITDARILARYGMKISPDATATEVEAAKKKYVESKDTIAGTWGGSLELNVLSHASGGKIAFLAVDSVRRVCERYCSNEEGHHDTVIEIPLHYGHIHGKVDRGTEPNHWSTFDYHMADGTMQLHWKHLHTETPAEREHRHEMLLKVATEADAAARQQESLRQAASAVLARQVHHTLNDGSASQQMQAGSTRAQPSKKRARAGQTRAHSDSEEEKDGVGELAAASDTSDQDREARRSNRADHAMEADEAAPTQQRHASLLVPHYGPLDVKKASVLKKGEIRMVFTKADPKFNSCLYLHDGDIRFVESVGMDSVLLTFRAPNSAPLLLKFSDAQSQKDFYKRCCGAEHQGDESTEELEQENGSTQVVSCKRARNNEGEEHPERSAQKYEPGQLQTVENKVSDGLFVAAVAALELYYQR